MIRVNIHAGPINKASRYNLVAWVDIAYERLEPIAHYKTVLFEAAQRVLQSAWPRLHRLPRPS